MVMIVLLSYECASFDVNSRLCPDTEVHTGTQSLGSFSGYRSISERDDCFLRVWRVTCLPVCFVSQ